MRPPAAAGSPGRAARPRQPASVRANQRFASTALRGADIFGTDTAVGTRLATAGRFLEQLGNDILRAAEKHWRATEGTGPQHTRTTHSTTTR